MTVLEPLKPLISGLYRCDDRFHLEALYEQLEEKNTYGFIVVDGNGVTLHSLNGNSRKNLFRLEVSLPKKHGRGGQSKNRFARIREEKRGWYTSKVCEIALYHFIDHATTLPNVSGLILAGSAQLKEEVLSKLDQRLARIIITVVDIQYGGESGFNQAIDLTKNSLGNLKFVHEQNVIASLFEEINKDGHYALGVEDTLYALTSGLLDTLLIWNNLSIIRWELEKINEPNLMKVIYLEEGKTLEEEEENQDWAIRSNMPLLDWILEHYGEFGANLELISDQTHVGAQFVK
jgi:peptide chain release factor subunit 1